MPATWWLKIYTSTFLLTPFPGYTQGPGLGHKTNVDGASGLTHITSWAARTDTGNVSPYAHAHPTSGQMRVIDIPVQMIVEAPIGREH